MLQNSGSQPWLHVRLSWGAFKTVSILGPLPRAIHPEFLETSVLLKTLQVIPLPREDQKPPDWKHGLAVYNEDPSVWVVREMLREISGFRARFPYR